MVHLSPIICPILCFLLICRINAVKNAKMKFSTVVANDELRTSPYNIILSVRGGANSDFSKVSLGKWVINLVNRIKRFFIPDSKDREKKNNQNSSVLEKKFRPGDANSRIQKELREFMTNPPDNCKVSVSSNIRVWVVTIIGAKNTIFEGERYKLKMTFPKEYPSKPPSVYFLKPTPKHQHVYTNGDICLSVLGKDWRPTMTAQSIAVSILSMLSSAKEKKMPLDNAMHADSPPGQQQDNWMYHDDKC